MDFLRNKEVKQQIAITISITFVVSIVGLLISPECCLFALASGITISISALIFTFRRYKKIGMLSQEIDRLLHGEEHICFDEFAEGELAVLENEISKMTLRLMEQAEQLRKDKTYLADSLADISHQLKTPLTSLGILNSALLQSNNTNEQRVELLQEQIKLLSRMEWLIANLLKLSRLDAGAIVFEKKEFTVIDLIKQAMIPLEVSADLKNITFDVDAAADVRMCGDQKWLAEALTNILKNCIESTPENGVIKLLVENNAMYVKIQILDNGCGIAEEDISHIFDRFYRGKNSNTSGVGIGLSLAKAIINQQNGAVSVENIEPHGAMFTIYFYKGIA